MSGATLHVRFSSIEALELLIRAGAEKEGTELLCHTPLHWAAQDGNVAAIELLVKQGVCKEAKDEFGDTPLHLAAFLGISESVHALIKAKADIEVQNNYGETPLHRAWQTGHTHIVEMLKKAGASSKANPKMIKYYMKKQEILLQAKQYCERQKQIRKAEPNENQPTKPIG